MSYSVYVTEEGIAEVARVDVAPTGIAVLAHQYVLSHLANPRGIVVGADNRIWFTESGTDSVGMIAPTIQGGTVTECRALLR